MNIRLVAVKKLMGDEDFYYKKDGTILPVNPVSVPSESEIQAKVQELQAEYEANEYQRQRAAEYPSWQDQLDKIYHDGVMAWQQEIKAIKDKYPKS